MTYKCPECGEGKVAERTIKGFATKVDGVSFVVPEARVEVCDRCDARFYPPTELARWRALFHAERVLPADAVKAIREKLELNINDFALLLGCSRQTIHNWERKDRRAPQMRIADLLLRLIEKSYLNRHVDVISFLENETSRSGTKLRVKRSERLFTSRLEPADFDRAFVNVQVRRSIPSLSRC